MKKYIEKFNKSQFKIFNSPAIELDQKVYDPNFTQEEKKQLRNIFRSLLNEYLIDFFKWQPEKEIRTVMTRIPHQVFNDRRLPLATYVGKYFIPVLKKAPKFPELAEQTDLRKLPEQSVGALLLLDIPIKDHPVFHTEKSEKKEEPSTPEQGVKDKPELRKSHTKRDAYIADLAGLSKTEKSSFVANHKGRLLDRINAKKVFGGEIQKDKLDKINFIKGLLDLTKDDKQLTEKLFALPNVNSLKDLSSQTDIDWDKIAKETGKEVKQIERSVTKAFPTAYTTARVNKVSQLLNKFIANNPQVDILTTKLKGSDETHNWKGIPKNKKKAVEKEIRQYQRVNFLTDNVEQIPKLINADISSSFDIVNTNRQDFYEKIDLPKSEAQNIYNKAKIINNEVLAALNLHVEQLQNTSINYINSSNKAGIVDDIDYQEIFGSLNFCECEHCNSVLSPAAYFVDLMYFIESNNSKALTELKRRRPDLWEIPLNCEQTLSTQPYLALINEVLGNYLVSEVSKLPNSPDNVEDILYLPWVNPELPYEPNCLKARTLANKLDTSLFEIYMSMELPITILMAEYLGLGPETLKWVIGGQPLPNDSPEIYQANIFANLFNLTYEELKVLAGSTIGKNISLLSIRKGIQEYEEQVKINLGSGQARADYLKEVFNFLRIYRHLDYTLQELDLYLELSEVGNKPYNALHLANFSVLMYLRDELSLSDESLTLLVRGYDTLQFGFAGNLDEQDQITFSNVLLELEVSQEDLTSLIDYFEDVLVFVSGKLELSVNNFSLLKQNIIWANGTSMSIQEWIAFIDFYRVKQLLVNANWQALLTLVIQHERIGIPVDLSEFYLKDNESTFWKFKVTEEKLVNWMTAINTNGTSFTNLDDWSLSVGELLLVDDKMVKVVFSQLVDQIYPTDGETRFIEDVNNQIGNEIDVASSPFKKVLAFYKLLDKNFQLISFLGIDAATLEYFFANAIKLNVNTSNPKTLLTGIYHFSKWMEGLDNDLSIFSILAIDGIDVNTVSEEQASSIEMVTKMSVVTLEKLIQLFNWQPLKLENWNKFFNAISICNDLNWTPEQLHIVTQNDASSNPKQYYQQVVAFLEQSLTLSSHTEDKKQTITDEVGDLLLETKRDAMVALLKKSLTVNFSKTSKIYEYFLLDVETSACADVSPIKAGILSVQLFIQRCLMNLEKNKAGEKLQFDEEEKKEWEWRKNYRVWEANRKIFLYPENYLDPNLRDDKTPIYEGLESDIQQRDLTLLAVEQTYRRYLKDFSIVAKLAMAGSFHDSDSNTYYYFGRTNNKPYKCFYRTFERSIKRWSHWNEIEVKIEADYLAGIIAYGRLFIFWKGYKKYNKSTITDGDFNDSSYTRPIVNYSYLEEDGSWSNTFSIEIEEREVEGFIQLFEDIYFPDFLNVKKVNNQFEVKLAYELSFAGYTEETVITIDIPNNNFIDTEDIPEYSITDICANLTDEGIEIFIPDLNTTEHHIWNSNEMSQKSSQVSPIITSDKPLSIINGQQTYNMTIKNAEKNYQYLFLNGGLYPLNSFIVNELSDVIFTDGLDDFLSPTTQLNKTETTDLVLEDELLAPQTIYLPEKGLDFNGPNGIYFKELYFHIPFTLAKHYNQYQKFEEADYWFRKIFDPTVEYATDAKYWQYVPFRTDMEEQLSAILTDQDALEKYHSDPFNPHAIARLRTSAYPKAVVMSYIDNLIDWGDQLFRKDTYESINEAMMLYITAQQLLGERPRSVATCNTANETSTFGDIEALLNNQNEILIEVESYITENKLANRLPMVIEEASIVDNSIIGLDKIEKVEKEQQTQPKVGYTDPTLVQSVTEELFCIPWNDYLLQYWDTIEDRMYKIRNCLNIDGEYRQLALFEPPIDPMLLARAKSAGISISSLLSNEKVSPYRFNYLLEKARSYTQMVSSYGQTLLSTMEKQDGEALNELRAIHENNILEMMTLSKEKQIEELEYSRVNLEINSERLSSNIAHFEGLIRGKGGIAFAMVDKVFKKSSGLEKSTQMLNLLTSGLYLIPQLGAPTAITFGGKNTGDSAKEAKQAIHSLGMYLKMTGEIMEKFQNHNIRNMNWQQELMTNQKSLETNANDLLVNDLKLAIAERELEVHNQRLEQNKEIMDFYADKMINQALYNMLIGHLTRLFRDAYSIAQQTAIEAQRAYRFETDNDSASFVGLDNWDTASMGLLSAEKLQFQLMQMESAYMEQNTRKHEIRSHVSLAQLDPNALLELKTTGECTVTLPEVWFDMQYPGLYKRKIKSVSISIPCVVGPYVNVACKLKLESSRMRSIEDLSALEDVNNLHEENKRIFTSNAQNDAGLLEFNFRDERYLPFEGAGVDSTWHLKLPSKIRAFNYNSITDVVFHINYTAVYSGILEAAIEDDFETSSNLINTNGGLFRVFSLKMDFPNEWHQARTTGSAMLINITEMHFPYFAKRDSFSIQSGVLNLYDEASGTLDEFSDRVSINSINGAHTVEININADEFEQELFLALNYLI